MKVSNLCRLGRINPEWHLELLKCSGSKTFPGKCPCSSSQNGGAVTRFGVSKRPRATVTCPVEEKVKIEICDPDQWVADFNGANFRLMGGDKTSRSEGTRARAGAPVLDSTCVWTKAGCLSYSTAI